MESDDALRRPIGWWLKEADARIDAALDGMDVDRRRWQVLTTLTEGPATVDDFADALRRST